MNAAQLKSEIKESYGQVAKDKASESCCGGDNCCGTASFSMAEDYGKVAGYQKDADLSLGCGLPTEIARIKEGDTVVDLGSGAGNDVFIARSIVGESGKVIGIDMTPEMVIRALQNNQKLGFKNVEFVLGDIEDMKGIDSQRADVVVSNCVMNLVPDKKKAFAEVFRILKVGGHFSISDIVFKGYLPDDILKAAELYAGCVSGASELGQYLGIIKDSGFKNIQIKKQHQIQLPDDLLLKHIDEEGLKQFKASGSGIFSITVYADKLESGNCCEPTQGNCCETTSETIIAGTGCCGSEPAQSTCCS